jgi:hypothetical protein
VQHLWILVQCRVDESDRRLAGFETLVVDAGEDGGEDGARSRGAADEGGSAFVEDDDVVADGGDVGVAAAGAVVCCRRLVHDLESTEDIEMGDTYKYRRRKSSPSRTCMVAVSS